MSFVPHSSSYSSSDRSASPLRYLDWPTVILYAILVVWGAISIYAASYDFDHASMFAFTEFSGKQFRWILLAFVAGFVILLTDFRIYEASAYPFYAAMMVLLLITIFIAPDIKGSHSWLILGPMSIQPAEFAKLATSLALAKLFSSYNFHINAGAANYAKALTIILLPIILILAQNETGSALAYLALFFVLYREGMSGLVLLAALAAVVIFVTSLKFTDNMVLGLHSGDIAVYAMIELAMVAMTASLVRSTSAARNMLILFATGWIAYWALAHFEVNIGGQYIFWGCIGVACIYLLIATLLKLIGRKALIVVGAAFTAVAFLLSVNYVFNNVMQPHQQKRILVTLGKEQDLKDGGYNVNQSKIAIGSGGIAGKGFLNGTQTKLKYVPEQHTDFIFCTIGEEQGFIGATGVLILFLMLILRVITIAERQPTTFGRVYGYCVASFLIFHLAINVGMVIGICPVIGIPLPFFSYGGSSLWGFTFLLFILLRIDASRREHLSY